MFEKNLSYVNMLIPTHGWRNE